MRTRSRAGRLVAALVAGLAVLLGGVSAAGAEVLPGDRAELLPAWGAPPLDPFYARPARPIVAIAVAPGGGGAWLAAADGTVAPFGDARWFPPSGPVPSGEPVVGIAATRSGQGYWLVDRVGRVFGFGDALVLPTRGALTPGVPVTGITATPSGAGYWVVAWDGSALAAGDAALAPSASGVPPAGVVALVPTPSGQGFWLASLDGRVFPYGDAPWFGAVDATAAGSAAVGMAASPAGQGYVLALADGRVLGFGDAAPFGVGAPCPARPAAGVVWWPSGGYALARSIPEWPGPANPAGLHPLDQVAVESAQMDALLDTAQACQGPWSGVRLLAPVGSAPITSGFGSRIHPIYGRPQLHSGVDFARPAGHPVRAAEAGQVVAVSTRAGFGRTVVVDHGGRVGTVYAHLSGVDVGVGQRVARGDVLGAVGSTGFATGPHLHFEVRVDGSPTNPLAWL